MDKLITNEDRTKMLESRMTREEYEADEETKDRDANPDNYQKCQTYLEPEYKQYAK